MFSPTHLLVLLLFLIFLNVNFYIFGCFAWESLDLLELKLQMSVSPVWVLGIERRALQE